MTSESPGEERPDDAIDAYLAAVEQALMRVRASVSEREQIRQDLESQIAEMTVGDSDEHRSSIQAVVASLEDPNHFAEMYVEQMRSAVPGMQSVPIRYSKWVVFAAVAMTAMLAIAVILAALSFSGGPAAMTVVMILMACELCGFLYVPFALRKASQQLRAEPENYKGSRLFIFVALAYGAVLPIAVLVLLCVATRGYILYPIALLAIGYALYLWICRLRQRLLNTVPGETPTPDSRIATGHFEYKKTFVKDEPSSVQRSFPDAFSFF